MKKAFSLKKKLSAALAVVLAFACFAGVTPANAADSTYSHDLAIGSGDFENAVWYLSDNKSGDTLSFAEDNSPVVTKGSITDWKATSLARRGVTLEAGKYQLSFRIKANEAATYSVVGFGFNSAGAAKATVFDTNAAGAVSADWISVTANFTADSVYTTNEFRVILNGDPGTQITVSDLDVRKITEQAAYRDVACLDDVWKFTYNTSKGYNNADEDGSKVELVENGCDDIGAIHFYKKNANHNEARICFNIQHRLTYMYELGTEFVFEANVKGTALNNGDNFRFVLDGTSQPWLNDDGTESNNVFSYSNAADNGWTTVKKSFKRNVAGDIYFTIQTGGFSEADLYIDNIKIYAKSDETKTNLLSGGDFYRTEPATSLEGWKRNEGANALWANVYYNPGYDDFKIEVVDEGCNGAGAVHFLKKNTYSFEDNPNAKMSARIVNFVDAETMSKFDVGTKFVFKADFRGTVADEDPLKITFEGSRGTYTWDDTNGLNYHDLKINTSEWESKEFEFTMSDKGHMFFVIRTGGFSIADLYIDNVQIYAKDDPDTNLISNSTFCEMKSVVSDSSSVTGGEFALKSIPGYDIGMLTNEKASVSAVSGASYDGSTALKITATGIEGYFQTYGNESKVDFPDSIKIKRGKIALVKGDIAVKASGYFKVLEGSSSKAEPKIWFGFGKELSMSGVKGDSVGSHYNESGKRYATEVFTPVEDGWVKFEMTVNNELLKKANSSLSDVERVRVMCGIDADASNDTYGAALFDDVKFEIVSQYAAGDTNGDDSIDIRDLVHMKKYAAGTVKFTEMTRGTWLSDIGFNEKPSISDELVAMRKFLIGSTSEYSK